MADGDAGGGEVHRAARVGAGRPSPPPARRDRAPACARGSRRPAPAAAPSRRRRRRSTGRRRRARRRRRRRRAPCAPARWARCTWRRWHGSCTITGPSRRVGAGSRSTCVGQPLVDVAHPGAERDAPRRCRAGGRSPSSPRRSRRSRRRSARRRASTPSPVGPARGRVGVQAGVGVQRAAAVAAAHRAARYVDARRRRARVAVPRWVSRMPGVHHAAGEQPDVVAGRRDRLAPRRSGRRLQPGAPGHEAQPLGAGQHGAPGEQHAVVTEHPERRRAASAASIRLLAGQRRRGCPPSGGRTAHRSGTPARNRGTARRSP